MFLEAFKRELHRIELLENKNQLIDIQLNNITQSYLIVLFTEVIRSIYSF